MNLLGKMKMSDCFDLEEKIMAAWYTEEDLALFFRQLCDAETPLDQDDIQNTVLGLIRLHNMRMGELWVAYKQAFQLDEYRPFKSVQEDLSL